MDRWPPSRTPTGAEDQTYSPGTCPRVPLFCWVFGLRGPCTRRPGEAGGAEPIETVGLCRLRSPLPGAARGGGGKWAASWLQGPRGGGRVSPADKRLVLTAGEVGGQGASQSPGRRPGSQTGPPGPQSARREAG